MGVRPPPSRHQLSVTRGNVLDHRVSRSERPFRALLELVTLCSRFARFRVEAVIMPRNRSQGTWRVRVRAGHRRLVDPAPTSRASPSRRRSESADRYHDQVRYGANARPVETEASIQPFSPTYLTVQARREGCSQSYFGTEPTGVPAGSVNRKRSKTGITIWILSDSACDHFIHVSRPDGTLRGGSKAASDVLLIVRPVR